MNIKNDIMIKDNATHINDPDKNPFNFYHGSEFSKIQWIQQKLIKFTGFDTNHPVYPSSQTESQAFYMFADYILNNHFLPFLKSRLTNEQVEKQII